LSSFERGSGSRLRKKDLGQEEVNQEYVPGRKEMPLHGAKK
jgi:hypothetical protein